MIHSQQLDLRQGVSRNEHRSLHGVNEDANESDNAAENGSVKSEAVFVSDLHLHPAQSELNARFAAFIAWARNNTRSVYILGDFLHAWEGDDGINDWSLGIAQQLHSLYAQGIKLYYMHGNRDFLLGRKFASLAGMQILPEPSIIYLQHERQLKDSIMLVHGDRYCTNDKSHQWFRLLTRNSYFPRLFLRLPLGLRRKLVYKIRQYSMANTGTQSERVKLVDKDMLGHMDQCKVQIVIHGHTHQPGVIEHEYNNNKYQQYVLSDWDDKPVILSYSNTYGFKFIYPID